MGEPSLFLTVTIITNNYSYNHHYKTLKIQIIHENGTVLFTAMDFFPVSLFIVIIMLFFFNNVAFKVLIPFYIERSKKFHTTYLI